MDTETKTGKKKGRHPVNALSDAFVRTVNGPGLFADGNGLYLKVDPSGARRWIQRIVIAEHRRDLAIGPVSITTLKEARTAAYDNKRMVRDGIDPRRAKKDSDA
ncbi:MAG: Arm DNA-binding domain-containing protein, partial [Paracoccaceae bacterium]